ncbi:PucR family transcriptional regulator ligand-binding domain-containing protein [Streptomyces sp. NPDC002896]|uniref:PucR family transcriptional regulator n=1 Tax=Streptomyces sp. NPDC002896 TaxID=3154438 RepID=UPI003324624D
MAITVQELLEIPHLQLRLLAGSGGVKREIAWVHTSDLPNPWQWQGSGELLLTNGPNLGSDTRSQLAFIDRLVEAGTSGLAVGTGTPGQSLTRAASRRADQIPLPVLSVPYSVPFTTVVRAVADANQREEARAVAQVARLYDLLRASVASGLPRQEMFRRLGRELGVRLYLIDPETGLSLLDDGEETSFADALVAGFQAHGRAIPGVLRLSRGGPHTAGTGATALAVAVPADTPAALVAEPLQRRFPGLVLLQHVATVSALELAQLAAERERRRRLGADLLGQLLDHRLDPRVAERQLAETDVDLADSVLVTTPASTDSTVDTVHRGLAQRRIPHLLLRREDILHIVFADEPAPLDRMLGLLDSAQPIGVSDRIASAERVPEALQQARWALGAAEAEGKRMIRFGDETALLLPRTPTEARAVASRILAPLISHDSQHGTGYLLTLRVMLRQNRSWRMAADELHIHKQTLGYRLRKIEQLTGRGLTRTDHIAELWFAMRAHDLVNGKADTGTARETRSELP